MKKPPNKFNNVITGLERDPSRIKTPTTKQKYVLEKNQEQGETTFYVVPRDFNGQTSDKKRYTDPQGYHYEEGLIYFDNQSEVTAHFKRSFGTPPIQAPVVVYSVEPTDNNSSNINVYGTDIPTYNSMFIGTSANFTGFIRYRATNFVSHSYVIVPGKTQYTSSYFQIYAGIYNLNSATDYTSSFILDPGGTYYEYRDTFHDLTDKHETNVIITHISMSNIKEISEILLPTTSQIHFIAVKM